MGRQILVPLDGTAMAESALPAALFWAKTFSMSIVLIHILEKKPPRRIHNQNHLTSVESAEKYLHSILATLEKSVAVTTHVHGESVDNVSFSIALHGMSEIDADLVVMCTHGNEKTRQLLFGTLAQKVIASGNVPVLTGFNSMVSTKPFVVKRILVPLDDTSLHQEILERVQSIALTCNASIVIVSVIPTVSTTPGGWLQIGRLHPSTTAELYDMREDAQYERFLEIKKQFLSAGISNFEGLLLRGDPSSLILEVSRKESFDLIIMGTHGRRGMDAVWQGSVASRIVQGSMVPMLLVPLSNKKTVK